jgi:aspartate aminotransferase
MKPNTRIENTRVSATVRLSQIARDLSAQGRNIVDLSEGESDFDTPAHVIEAAHAAMLRGETRYTAVSGTPALKAAVASKFERDNNLRYTPEHIVVGCGAKQIIFNALFCTLESGDEVIIPAPYWVSYPDIVRIAGGTPVIVSCPSRTGFKLTPNQLATVIGERTKWLILNTPGNPSGAVYSASDLKKLADVLRRHPDVHILMDDIYEHIVFDTTAFATMADVAPDLADRILTVNGVSKAYAMTGWRIGYAGGPIWLAEAMTKLQGQSTTNPCSISQEAARAALEGPQGFLDDWRTVYRRRRDLVQDRLRNVSGLTVNRVDGAFYLFVGCTELMGTRTPDGGTLANDQDLAAYLIEEAGVVCVAGSEFGHGPYLRLCFAKSDAELEDACDRIASACHKLAGIGNDLENRP